MELFNNNNKIIFNCSTFSRSRLKIHIEIGMYIKDKIKKPKYILKWKPGIGLDRNQRDTNLRTAYLLNSE